MSIAPGVSIAAVDAYTLPSESAQMGETSEAMMLHTQIKCNDTRPCTSDQITPSNILSANAQLLFPRAMPPGATASDWEIGIAIAKPGDDEKQPTQSKYKAILTHTRGLNQKRTIAAKGASCDSMINALRNLLEATGVALERFQGNALIDMITPMETAGATLDENLIHKTTESSWGIF